MQAMSPSNPEQASEPPPLTRTVTKVQELATSQLDAQKGKIADVVQSTGSAIRQASQGLKEQGQQGLAEYADQGAEKVESVSTYLRETDAQEMIAKAQETARKQPLLLMAAGFAVAFVVARVLKGSVGQRAQQPEASSEDTEPPPPQPAQEGEFAALVPVVPVEESPKPRRRRAAATVETPTE